MLKPFNFGIRFRKAINYAYKCLKTFKFEFPQNLTFFKAHENKKHVPRRREYLSLLWPKSKIIKKLLLFEEFNRESTVKKKRKRRVIVQAVQFL